MIWMSRHPLEGSRKYVRKIQRLELSKRNLPTTYYRHDDLYALPFPSLLYENASREKRRVLSHPDCGIGNRPHMAKFKVVRNVRLFTSYSIDSNLQDEIAGQDGIRKLTFHKFDGRSPVKYLWGIVKQIQHGLFREVVKIPGPSVLDAWDYFPPLRVGK